MKKENIEIDAKFTFLIVGVFIVLFIIVGAWALKRIERKDQYCIEKGERAIAFYSYTTGRTTSKSKKFEFQVNNRTYYCRFKSVLHVNPQFQYKIKPMIVAYDKNDPERNVCMPEEEFQYKEYIITWKQLDDSYDYFMFLKKVDANP